MLRILRSFDTYVSCTFKQNYYKQYILRRSNHGKKTCPQHKEGDGASSNKTSDRKLCPKERKQLMDVDCKTAVVVGGAEGIGYATAHELLAHKAKVVGIFGKDVCKGLEACYALNCRFGQRKAVFYKVDVLYTKEMECAICKMTQEFGRIHAFINSFGICDGKNWEEELNTNLIGMARSTVLAHQYLSDLKAGGAIVNIAGIFGLTPSAGCPTTSAAQHGIIGLSRSFGKQSLFKHTNVRVIALCPGITKSGLFKKANDRALTGFMGKCLKEEVEAMKKQRPEVCGSSVALLLRFADSGTLWLIEDSQLFQLECECPYCCAELFQQFPP